MRILSYLIANLKIMPNSWKKLFNSILLSLVLTFFSLNALCQGTEWGAWKNFPCWKYLYFRVRRDAYNSSARQYPWYVQFKSRYNTTINFSYAALSPQQNEAYKTGSFSPEFGREHLNSSDSNGDDHAGSDVSGSLLSATQNIYVVIRDVRFGSDDSGGYATDECGRPSASNGGGDNSGSSNGNASLNNNSDLATPQQQPYELIQSRDGVSVYVAFITMGGNTLNAAVKIVNNNGYSVIVTWGGPKWFDNSAYLDPNTSRLNGISAPSQTGYSDKFAPGEMKDASQHMPGTHGAEVIYFRPNWLYFDAPKGKVWQPGELSFGIENLKVLDLNGRPLNGSETEAVANTHNTSVQSNNQQQQAISNQQHATQQNPLQENLSSRNNIPNQPLQDQANQPRRLNQAPNNAQNSNNDAIQNQLALNRAKINAMGPGGTITSQQQYNTKQPVISSPINSDKDATDAVQKALQQNLLQINSMQSGRAPITIPSALPGNSVVPRQSTNNAVLDAANKIFQVYADAHQARADYDAQNLRDASNGDTHAMNLVAITAMGDRDYTTAAYWDQKSADGGNPTGMLALAELYDRGWGVDKNIDFCIYWQKKAADMGWHDGIYKLAFTLTFRPDCESKLAAISYFLKSDSLAPYEKRPGVFSNEEKFNYIDTYKWADADGRIADLILSDCMTNLTEIQKLKIAINYYQKSIMIYKKKVGKEIRNIEFSSWQNKLANAQARLKALGG